MMNIDSNPSADDHNVIEVASVSKRYDIYDKPFNRLLHPLAKKANRILNTEMAPRHREFWALRDISFSVRRGETIGILGSNGSGKSTLLQVICGTLKATEGHVRLTGRVAALLELGAGFNPEFTGRENARMNAAILGCTDEEIAEILPLIIEFADLGTYIDEPVKNYSTGMYARLGFAVGIHVKPDIFIIDEALSVGDIFFQSRCFRKLDEFREAGGTVLFVSHDTSAISRICDRAVVLHKGKKIYEGSGADAINVYYAAGRGHVVEASAQSETGIAVAATRFDALPITPSRVAAVHLRRDHVTGNGAAEIVDVRIVDDNGQASQNFAVGEKMTVEIDVLFTRPLEQFDFGVGLRDRTGMLLGGSHSFHEGKQYGPVAAGQSVTLRSQIELSIQPSQYLLLIGISRNFSHQQWEEYCCLWDCCAIDVTGNFAFWGAARLNSSSMMLT